MVCLTFRLRDFFFCTTMLVILQNIFTENFQHLIFNVISKNKVLLKFGSFWEIFSWIINHIYIFRPSASFNLIIYFMGFNYQNKSSQIRNSSWNYSISSCEAKYRRNKKDPKLLKRHRNNRLDFRILQLYNFCDNLLQSTNDCQSFQ